MIPPDLGNDPRVLLGVALFVTLVYIVLRRREVVRERKEFRKFQEGLRKR